MNTSVRPYQFDAALNAMIDEICKGREFPDAAYRVSTRFRVNQSLLERAYDDWCAGNYELRAIDTDDDE